MSTIRIGVVPSAAAIEIGSPAAFELRNKVTGELLLSGTNETLEVSLGGDVVIETNYRLQVVCTGDPSDLLARAEALGYETYTEDAGPCIRVFLGKFAADAPWSLRNDFRNAAIADGLAGSDSFWKTVTVSEGRSYYLIERGGEEIASEDPVVLEPAEGGLVSIAGRLYRGVAEVAVNSAGTLAGINELPIDQYLYGVVPRELPPEPYGLLEAQKAQAVAARTYALANLGKRRADGYDLLPTTSDQVYGGYEDEHPVSSQAVDETSGVVAMYGGDYAATLFHSTSGGYTANNEDVYSSGPIPYLRGVPDSPTGEALEQVPSLEVFKRHPNPISLRNTREGDYESDWSRYHRWYVSWSADEISRVVSAYANVDVGRVLAINVLGRADSGRVLPIEYVTENGSYYDSKDRIRSSLKYVNATGGLSSLRSTLFFVEPVVDAQTGTVTGFEAWGGGWGHGVGMSQTGAVGMAEKKATFDEILAYYYRGISLVDMY